MAEAYLALKWVHVVGATLLFGTGLGTAFHFWMAHRTGDARTIAAAARVTVIADYAFTLPAVVLQPLTGMALAHMAGYPLGSPWIVASVLLYLLAGACWVPVVFIQRRLRDIAGRCAAAGKAPDAEYARLARWWFALGWPAFLALAAVFWLMIARPA
jgi:uncharacterized membrane protein